MWPLIQSLSSYLSFQKSNNECEPSNIEDILKEDDSDDEVAFGDGTCKNMSGTVTHLYEEHGLVDGRFYFEVQDVPNNLELGDYVSFMAFRKLENEEWRVKTIYTIQKEFWEFDDKEESLAKKKVKDMDLPEQKNGALLPTRPLFRIHIGRVVQRFGRDIVISPGNMKCSLDEINAEFIPLEGDYVQLNVEFITDNVTERIIKLDNLKPLRSKTYIGKVTHWEPLQNVGIISREVYFSKLECEPGFIPVIGDEVIADVIESDQGSLVWRALQVLPSSIETQKLPTAPRNRADLEDLLQNKQGIYIREVTDVGMVELGKEKPLEVEVQNGGTNVQVLKSCSFCFKNSMPQFVLLHPLVLESLDIPPDTSVTFTFNAKARFVGKSDEVFVWSFEGFNIGRQLKIDVQNLKSEKLMSAPSVYRGRNYKHVSAKQLMATRNGFVVPGVRPIKPPAFIPVSLGVFKVPERLINIVVGGNNKQRHEIEVKTYVCQAYPCLEGPLTPEVYRERWHILLFLEEIQNMIDTSMHNISNATFTRTRDYLALEIPGLAEKRPSLVVGDKVIVRKEWADTDWQNFYTKLKSDKSTSYEGYIHKVLNNEILIKFGPTFHDSYSGDYTVNFYSGRMSFRRTHQAVNVAVNHLHRNWLFPSSVIYQSPQVVILENIGNDADDDKGKPICVDIKKTEIKLEGNNNDDVLKNTSFSETREGEYSNDLTENAKYNCQEDNVTNYPLHVNFTDNSPALTCEPVNLKPCNINQRINWNSKCKLKMGKQETSPIDFSLHFKKQIQWFNTKLNHQQKQAVRYILMGEARPLPYVIFGPPGTGKTITLVETALQLLSLLPDSRLIIATPSNSAADLVAERLLDSGLFSQGMLLRLLSHHYAECNRLPLHLVPVSGVANMKEHYQESESRMVDGHPIKNLGREDIGHHRVTIGTFTTLGILYVLGFPEGHFTHILIDEAGQAMEPELLIPLAFLHKSSGQVILAGDPLQLGPVVISNVAADLGLSESFLSRLLRRSLYSKDMIGFPVTGGYNPHLITKLVNNYRSLPEIINLPSMMFYDSDLVPLVKETGSEEAKILSKLNECLDLPLRSSSILPPAILFHGVRGCNTQSPESPSWYNPQEAIQVGYYVEQAYECGLDADHIGIVTPYQKQASKIRETLDASELPIPKVGSVEEFQGQERMMIILSTVRSNMKLIQKDVIHSLGFVASPRRLNVALTRARALLIIIGDPHLLSFDNYWRTVLTYCVKHNAYIGCDLPLSLAELTNNTNDVDIQTIS